MKQTNCLDQARERLYAFYFLFFFGGESPHKNLSMLHAKSRSIPPKHVHEKRWDGPKTSLSSIDRHFTVDISYEKKKGKKFDSMNGNPFMEH